MPLSAVCACYVNWRRRESIDGAKYRYRPNASDRRPRRRAGGRVFGGKVRNWLGYRLKHPAHQDDQYGEKSKHPDHHQRGVDDCDKFFQKFLHGYATFNIVKI